MSGLVDGPLQAGKPVSYGGTVPLQKDGFHTPDWAKHAVWYQVMLDRFRNGSPDNDRQPVRSWTSEWFTPSPWEGRDGQTFYDHYVFDRQYGGDLDGLEEKLPYLAELGVNAIYLNPIFKAESYHKYNAETYLHVDDHFGTTGDYAEVAATEDHTDPSTWKWTESDRRFLRFLKTAHRTGFKVIIDGVFNHVGTAHPAFQDVKNRGRKSRYADWFNVTSWKPFKHEGWFGHASLPVFKKSKDGLASEQVRQYLFNVTRRWMDPDGDGDPSDGIDGWRLDVPNEIPAPFWVQWRKLVKSINPEAYITGEIWERADQWLDGRHFDAVMNYEFARAVVAWVFNRKLKVSPSEIDQRLRELRLAYPLEATLVLQNVLDSHDTDRLASMAHNPDRQYDSANRPQDNGPDYDNSKPTPAEYARVRLAALLQMTYVGAPMIYYGDEVGMWGADDPTCRKPMLWEDLQPYEKPDENFVMQDQLAFYRQIIGLRNAHPALRTGSFHTLLTDDRADVWAFLRRDHDEQLVIVLNASDQDRRVTVPLPLRAPNKWTGLLNAEGVFDAADHKLGLRVPAVGGLVLHAATPKSEPPQ
jgi:glycosidase